MHVSFNWRQAGERRTRCLYHIWTKNGSWLGKVPDTPKSFRHSEKSSVSMSNSSFTRQENTSTKHWAILTGETFAVSQLVALVKSGSNLLVSLRSLINNHTRAQVQSQVVVTDKKYLYILKWTLVRKHGHLLYCYWNEHENDIQGLFSLGGT